MRGFFRLRLFIVLIGELAFAATKQFLSLPKDDKMNAIAFILTMEQTNSKFAWEDYIAEDIIAKRLDELEDKNSDAPDIL